MKIQNSMVQDIWKTTELASKRQKLMSILDRCKADSPTIIDMKKRVPSASANKIDSMASNLLLAQFELKVIR